MLVSNRKRPKIGDVIEIPTPVGFAYAHYTYNYVDPPKYGALLYVLPGIYDERPGIFSEVVKQHPQFITFFPLGTACYRGITCIVANEEIPSHAIDFPTFRSCIRTHLGNGPWWLWDGKKEWKIGDLKPGMEQYPIRGVWNDTLLIERIVSKWRHEFDA